MEEPSPCKDVPLTRMPERKYEDLEFALGLRK
jgi:hypothetical protein